MQYMLTQAEYDALVPKKDLERMTEARDAIVDALVGDKCVHSADRPPDTYCDDCPLAHMKGGYRFSPCGRPREFSK